VAGYCYLLVNNNVVIMTQMKLKTFMAAASKLVPCLAKITNTTLVAEFPIKNWH
jgi:hypothetical protein